MARKTKEDAEVTRQNLLSGALKVFSRQGYAAARLEDIAEEAGVTRGAIYWHFKNKADLYNTLVGETLSGIQSVVDRAVRQGGTFLEIQRRVMIYITTLPEVDEDYRAVMELTILKTGYEPELEEGMRAKNEVTHQVEAQLAGYFRMGIAIGEVRAELDPVIAARSMMAYMNGIVLNWLMDQQAFSLRQCAPALIDIYIRGIAARPYDVKLDVNLDLDM
ncbi:MAG TPA: TetR family transcriptional regulator [Ktedonobacterales bacterium]|nr:TetR family transcriptional regulator [Ktedonobacterales bacterium]